MKKGILLLAYGAPNSMDDIRDYYIDVTGGRIPTDEMVGELKERYRAIGGESPLLPITRQKAEALEKKLGSAYTAYVGMRHWHPYIQDTVKKMANDGISHAVAIVMAPHYSDMSIGKYYRFLDEANQSLENPINFHKVQSWHQHPGYLNAVADRLEDAAKNMGVSSKNDVTVIFTAHSLPERILENNDPYPDELMATSSALAEQTGYNNWAFAYQSAGRTKEPWLGPDLVNKMNELAEKGQNNQIICPVGFISDHLEILYDIDIEAEEEAREKGINMKRIKMLNDHPLLIEAFADMVKNAPVWKQMSS